MFAELIFVLLAIFGLLLVDNFSTSCALIACTLFAYYYVDHFPFVLNKYLIVNIITKTWATFACCYRIGKQIFNLFQRLFFKKASATPLSPSYNFCGNTANIEKEINILVANISKYYIHSWYDKISSNEEFVSYLNSSINDSLVSLCSSITKVDKKKFTYIILKIYLNFFSHFIEAKKKSDVFNKENFKMKHWAMKDKTTEWCYLQSLVSALLDSFCPSECERSLHSKCSPILHSVVVEILTGNLILPLVNLLCDPSRLNLMFLKLLIHININVPIGPNFPQKGMVLFPSVDKPTILLPNEELSDNCDDVNPTEMESKNMLSVPDNCMRHQIQETISKFVVGKLNDNKVSNNSPCSISSGVKSTSNINISDHSILNNSRTLDCDNYSSFVCDTTIKRSRSADYIRQMPQLKAFNGKDYNIVPSHNNKMLVALKPDVSSSNAIEQAEEAIEFEVPTLFTDVKITDTFQQNEAGLIPYTLYCIQYTGIFHDTGNTSDTPHLVDQVISIKRRFREFVALQSRLEDNPALKNCLKGIKGPSRGVALPFSNLDKKNIAERRIFLENYLKELCSLPPVAQSLELQEFLGYGVDEQVSFGRRNTDASVPRIDKIVIRGVKSAFDIFKIALPNAPPDEENVFLSEPVFEDSLPEFGFQEHLLDYSSREPEIYEHAKNFRENSSFELSSEDCKNIESTSKITSLLQDIHSFNPAANLQCSTVFEKKYFEEKNPLANTVFELMAVAFQLNECNTDDMISIMKLSLFSFVKVLFASHINNLLSNKLDCISEKHVINCLHILHKYLWPDEKSSNEQYEQVDGAIMSSKIMEHLEVVLSSVGVIQNFNCVVKILLEKLNLILSSIQYQETNRCLLYQLFDVIVETLCSN